jgi:hypothetical protein
MIECALMIDVVSSYNVLEAQSNGHTSKQYEI